MENQSSIYSAKTECPFACLFKCLSPKDFASVFGGEAEQTIAFLLSFSCNRGYAKKVLKILNDEDLTDIVSCYLRNVSEEGVDPEFIKKIEAFLESSMQHWKHLSFSRRLRKNIFIRGRKLIKSSEVNDSGKDVRDFGGRHNYYLFPENLFRYINSYRRKHTVKIEYKNDTSAPVNIRGKKLRPGESIVSQVFIKPFEEFVKKGDLTIYVDGMKIGFEQIPDAEAQVANGEPVKIPADSKALETAADKTAELAGPEKSEETPEVTAPEIPVEEKTEETGEAREGGENTTETAEAEVGEKPAEETTAETGEGDKAVGNAEAQGE